MEQNPKYKVTNDAELRLLIINIFREDPHRDQALKIVSSLREKGATYDELQTLMELCYARGAIAAMGG